MVQIPALPFFGGPPPPGQPGPPRPPVGPGAPAQAPRPPQGPPLNGPLIPGGGPANKPKFLDQVGIPEMGTEHSSSSYSVTCILFTGIIFVVAVFVTIAALVNSLHRVQEGDVAVYFSNGALQEGVTGAGVHWSTPFVTTVHMITVRPETRYLNPLECTTSDGVVNVFREIALISSIERERVHYLVQTFGHDVKQILVYDRITEGIQGFCANHSIDEVFNTQFLELGDYVRVFLNQSISRFAQDGISVWNLFIPKPQIPPAIAANYREVKIEWTQQLVALQQQKTERIRKETILQNAKLDAQRLKDVSAIEMQKILAKQEQQAKVQDIINETENKKAITVADSEAYISTSRAAANQQLLTDQFIKLEMAKAMMNNTKVFFSGQDSSLGGLLTKLFEK